MPWNYIARVSGQTRNYVSSYTKADLEKAISSVESGTSLREAAKEYCIPLGTLHNKVHRKHNRQIGGQTVLTYSNIYTTMYCTMCTFQFML